MNGRCLSQDRIIESKNKARAFEDKQGIKRNVTEIVGDQVLMLDKKRILVGVHILYCPEWGF